MSTPRSSKRQREEEESGLGSSAFLSEVENEFKPVADKKLVTSTLLPLVKGGQDRVHMVDTIDEWAIKNVSRGQIHLLRASDVCDEVQEATEKEMEDLHQRLAVLKHVHTRAGAARKDLQKSLSLYDLDAERLGPDSYDEKTMRVLCGKIGPNWSTIVDENFTFLKQHIPMLNSIDQILEVEDKEVFLTFLKQAHARGLAKSTSFQNYMLFLKQRNVFYDESFQTNRVLHSTRYNLKTLQYLVAMYARASGWNDKCQQGYRFFPSELVNQSPWFLPGTDAATREGIPPSPLANLPTSSTQYYPVPPSPAPSVAHSSPAVSQQSPHVQGYEGGFVVNMASGRAASRGRSGNGRRPKTPTTPVALPRGPSARDEVMGNAAA